MMVMLMGSSSSCYLLVGGGGGFGSEADDVLSSLSASGVSSVGFVSTQFVCMDCERIRFLLLLFVWCDDEIGSFYSNIFLCILLYDR